MIKKGAATVGTIILLAGGGCVRGGFHVPGDGGGASGDVARTDGSGDGSVEDGQADGPLDRPLAPDTVPDCGILVYLTATAHDGDFGGRSGLDKFCVDNKPSALTCSAVHALISVDPNDTLAMMPTTFGYDSDAPLCWFEGSTSRKTLFADNWADMLDGTIKVSRLAGTGSDTYAWTGSNNSGQMRQDAPDSKCGSLAGGVCRFSCLNWTSTSYGGASGSHWSFSYWYFANVNCAPVGMPDVTQNWLLDLSTFAKKRGYGPTTCCGYNEFACPSACPADSYVEDDFLSCGASAHVMCACAQ